jgi:uncharacterized protein (TIGR03492 family)
MELTLISNGHGEDVIAAALADALVARDASLELRAFPLVDRGEAFAARGIARLGPCRAMPSGGFTLHSWANLRADLGAGFLGMTGRQLGVLARLRSDAVVVVGDVYAQALAGLVRGRFRAVLQPLVSAHLRSASPPAPHRYFMERISYPERALMRHLASVVYARDEATARWLRDHGVRLAVALGNPMVDRAVGRPLPGLPPGAHIALLPGTRAHTPAALVRMAQGVAALGDTLALVAWGGGEPPALPGWAPDPEPPPVPGLRRAWRHGGARLWLIEGRFGDVLASACCALGTAGTANEQAAAMGLPVVSFPLPPHYTAAYLTNQKRLLGEALEVTTADAPSLAAALAHLRDDATLRRRRGEEGRARMGGGGGSAAIADDLLRRLHAAVARAPR